MPHNDDPARHEFVERLTETVMHTLLHGQQGMRQCAFCTLITMAAKCMGTLMLMVDDTPETRTALPAEMMERAIAHRDELLKRKKAHDGRIH